MSLNIDIASDFAEIVDWINPVTVDGVDVDTALRRAIDTKEAAASDGKYLTSDVAFHLDVADHASRPEIGKAIVDGDGTWTILSVAKQTLANRWRCVCRQLTIDPAVLVSIQRATYEKGTTGAIEPSWTTIAIDVVAKVQRLTQSMDVAYGNRTGVTDAVVYFAEEYELQPADRIIGPDNEVLKVLSWDGFDRIDMLFKASCEISQWPQS